MEEKDDEGLLLGHQLGERARPAPHAWDQEELRALGVNLTDEEWTQLNQQMKQLVEQDAKVRDMQDEDAKAEEVKRRIEEDQQDILRSLRHHQAEPFALAARQLSDVSAVVCALMALLVGLALLSLLHASLPLLVGVTTGMGLMGLLFGKVFGIEIMRLAQDGSEEPKPFLAWLSARLGDAPRAIGYVGHATLALGCWAAVMVLSGVGVSAVGACFVAFGLVACLRAVEHVQLKPSPQWSGMEKMSHDNKVLNWLASLTRRELGASSMGRFAPFLKGAMLAMSCHWFVIPKIVSLAVFFGLPAWPVALGLCAVLAVVMFKHTQDQAHQDEKQDLWQKAASPGAMLASSLFLGSMVGMWAYGLLPVVLHGALAFLLKTVAVALPTWGGYRMMQRGVRYMQARQAQKREAARHEGDDPPPRADEEDGNAHHAAGDPPSVVQEDPVPVDGGEPEHDWDRAGSPRVLS